MRIKMLREFIVSETTAGFCLFLAAVLAIIVDNSSWAHYYHDILHHVWTLHLHVVVLSKSIHHWVNDGLMTIFFLLVGLEIKRELFEGELSSLSQASLPGIAAIGGMVVPGMLYWIMNHADSTALRGWAIPTATDIAFSLGILSLLGRRVPLSLKVFLMALAIFDDMGAIIIIAIFYTPHVHVYLLAGVAVMFGVLIVLNRLRIHALSLYLIIGAILWFCLLRSGVHATLAGILLAFTIPLNHHNTHRISPLHRLEHALNPWVAFLVLPLFAFTNAGINFSELPLTQVLSAIPLGIFVGLFIGKQIGITGFAWLAIKCGVARLPTGVKMSSLYGVSLLCGVGFTMSLFIGSLAFDSFSESYEALVRVGVIGGSLISGLLGYVILRCVSREPGASHSNA